MDPSWNFVALLLILSFQRSRSQVASETKPSLLSSSARLENEDLSPSGSTLYPYTMTPGNPLASLALLANPPPPAAYHPLLLATLLAGSPMLPPAAVTPAAAAIAAASTPSLSYVGAGQGHNPLLAYLLAQYARQGPYSAMLNYSLPGYSATNNVHNSKAFGGYKYEDRN